MKSINILFTICVALVFITGCGPSEVAVSKSFQFKKPIRLAVLDFDWTPPKAKLGPKVTMVNFPNAGKYVADSVSNVLVDIKGFEIIERSRLNKFLDEEDMKQAELIRKGEYKKIGIFLDVDYLVLGTVASYTVGAIDVWVARSTEFSCRCVNVYDGTTIFSIKGYESAMGGSPGEGLKNILSDAVPKLKEGLNRQRVK